MIKRAEGSKLVDIFETTLAFGTGINGKKITLAILQLRISCTLACLSCKINRVSSGVIIGSLYKQRTFITMTHVNCKSACVTRVELLCPGYFTCIGGHKRRPTSMQANSRLQCFSHSLVVVLSLFCRGAVEGQNRLFILLIVKTLVSKMSYVSTP